MDKIVGEQLSSVEFVQDYVQLHFDGPTLTLFVWPTVLSGDCHVHFGEPGYRDTLCDRIAHKVAKVAFVEDEYIRIDFDDRWSIVASLKPEDRVVPEAGYFTASRDPTEPWLIF